MERVSAASPVDVQLLDQLRDTVGGDDDFLEELLRNYLADGGAQLATMKRALAARDTATLGRAAHSLKSNSAGVGATHLAALCAELEAQVRGGALDGVDDGITRVETELGRVTGALERRLTSNGTAGAGS